MLALWFDHGGKRGERRRTSHELEGHGDPLFIVRHACGGISRRVRGEIESGGRSVRLRGGGEAKRELMDDEVEMCREHPRAWSVRAAKPMSSSRALGKQLQSAHCPPPLSPLLCTPLRHQLPCSPPASSRPTCCASKRPPPPRSCDPARCHCSAPSQSSRPSLQW